MKSFVDFEKQMQAALSQTNIQLALETQKLALKFATYVCITLILVTVFLSPF